MTIFLPPVFAGDAEITGLVTRIFDGDTLEILDSGNTRHRIRLQGIDAPERGQAYSSRSRQALAKIVFKKTVRITTEGEDIYGRTLGQVYYADLWVNREMVRTGMAWHYAYFSSDRRLADSELEARAARAGLWADPDPVPPWIFRRQDQAGKESRRIPSPNPAENKDDHVKP